MVRDIMSKLKVLARLINKGAHSELFFIDELLVSLLALTLYLLVNVGCSVFSLGPNENLRDL